MQGGVVVGRSGHAAGHRVASFCSQTNDEGERDRMVANYA